MNAYKRCVLAAVAAIAIAVVAAGASLAGESARHVVSAGDIQSRIDQQVGQADADRQAIQVMLQRADVRRIAGSAGLDLKRASAAAAVLSGPALESLSAQAREVNAGLAGGYDTIVISTTGIIIVLLIIIILVR